MEDWKKELEELGERERECKEEQKLVAVADVAARQLNMEKAKSFLCEQVELAFNELTTELEKYEKDVFQHAGTLERHLEIQQDTGEKAIYTIRVCVGKRATTAQKGFSAKDASGKMREEGTGVMVVKSNGVFLNTGDISNITKNDIITDFMVDYKRWKRR